MGNSGRYPQKLETLQKKMGQLGADHPKAMGGFMQLHKGALESGALSAKTKELIALAIAITVRCDGCISFHVHDAMKAGVTKSELVEAVGVAVLMGGGPSVVYGCEALTAWDQFEGS